jgi:hypothetical protein
MENGEWRMETFWSSESRNDACIDYAESRQNCYEVKWIMDNYYGKE